MGEMSKSDNKCRSIMSYKTLPPPYNISLMAGPAGPGLLVVLLLLLVCHRIPSCHGDANISVPYNLSSPACNANITGESYCNVELRDDDAETLLEEVGGMIIGESLGPSRQLSGRYLVYPAVASGDAIRSGRPAKANARGYACRGSNYNCNHPYGGGI